MSTYNFLLAAILCISNANAQEIKTQDYLPLTDLKDFQLKGKVREVISTVKDTKGNTTTLPFVDHEYYDQIKYEFDSKGKLTKKTNYLDYRKKLGVYSFTDYSYSNGKISQQITTVLNNGEDPKRIATDKQFVYNSKGQILSIAEKVKSKTSSTSYQTDFDYLPILQQITTKTDGVLSSKNQLYYNKKGLLIKEETLSFDGKKGLIKYFVYNGNQPVYQEELVNKSTSITFLDASTNQTKYQQFDNNKNLKLEITKDKNNEIIGIKNQTFRNGKSQLDIYTISYTFDAAGNWTKAVINQDNQLKYNISREIIYN